MNFAFFAAVILCTIEGVLGNSLFVCVFTASFRHDLKYLAALRAVSVEAKPHGEHVSRGIFFLNFGFLVRLDIRSLSGANLCVFSAEFTALFPHRNYEFCEVLIENSKSKTGVQVHIFRDGTFVTAMFGPLANALPREASVVVFQVFFISFFSILKILPAL